MGVFSGSEEMNNTCRRRINTVTMDRGFTIFVTQGYSLWNCIPCHNNHKPYIFLTRYISSLQFVVRINSKYVLTSCKKNCIFSKVEMKFLNTISSSSAAAAAAAALKPWVGLGLLT
jgi:hypothetical protein